MIHDEPTSSECKVFLHKEWNPQFRPSLRDVADNSKELPNLLQTFGKLCHTYLYHQYWQPTLKIRIVFILVIYYPAAYHLVVAFNNPWLINQFRIVLYLPKNTINATKWRWRYHRALSLFLSSSWSMPWYWDFLSINFNINQLAIVLFKLDKNMLKRS